MPGWLTRGRATSQWSSGVWALLVDSFASNFGFFLLMPILAVYLTRGLGWPAWVAGLILALRQFCQQGLAPWGGAWADRLGYRQAVVLGMEVRAVGFLLFAVARDPALVLLATILSGLGGALFGPADAAALAVAVKKEDQPRIFAQRVVFGNAGMVLGPVLGAYLLGVSFAWVAGLAGTMFLLAGIFTWFFYPAAAGTPAARAAEPLAWRRVLANRPFVALIAAVSGYYLLSAQINVLLPLVIVGDHAPAALIGWIMAAYSGTAILLQTTVTRWCARVPIARQLMLGMATAALGTLLASLSGVSTLWLWPWALSLSAASMLINPAMFTATSRLASQDSFGMYYGFSRLSLGIGGSVGNAMGGALYSLGASLGAAPLAWLLLGVVGLFTTGAMGRLRLDVDLPARPEPSSPRGAGHLPLRSHPQ
jgi:DHA1 family multidrug resistance protein-like MFS transporter